MEKGKYYITTAIAYASGKPHIGNTYEIILADSIARYKRNEGFEVFFQTFISFISSYTIRKNNLICITNMRFT